MDRNRAASEYVTLLNFIALDLLTKDNFFCLIPAPLHSTRKAAARDHDVFMSHQLAQ